MIPRIILLCIISIDVLILLFQTSILSISNHEADLLYGNFSFIQLIENISLALLGQNDLALRLPMIIFHILSVILLYKISKKYLINYRNRIWLILVFVLLPGVISSALLVDSAGFVIFGLLLFIYIYEKLEVKYSYYLLSVLSILDGTFISLFLSLIFYSFYKKDKEFLLFNIFLFIVSLLIYGFDASGSPKGHLLDTIGLYSAIFTPIIFVYIFYVLYKKFLSKNIDILWFISTIPLLLSLLLSFRQRIYIEEFAPYLIVALPIVAQSFYSSYRVRLKVFRGKYKTIFVVSAMFLLLNFIVVLFNRELYFVIDNPSKHFAKKMHIAKELAQELKNKDILCVQTDKNMARRLKFYGINNCEQNILKQQELSLRNEKNSVTISYRYVPIYSASVTNINIK
ncbi:MAG: hypothetical protein J7J96_07450 [Sulfurimonas sp.]|nr:hypothetical protein [Sulfurimonas sp.]